MHFSFTPTLTSTSEALRRSFGDRLLATITGRSLARSIAAGGRFSTSRRSGTVDDAHDVEPAAELVVVDDPDGTMRLIGVSGVLDPDVIDRIDDALVLDGAVRAVHLDVSEVASWSADLLRELEDVLERIEDAGIRLRVVGLDPRLPALPIG